MCGWWRGWAIAPPLHPLSLHPSHLPSLIPSLIPSLHSSLISAEAIDLCRAAQLQGDVPLRGARVQARRAVR